MSPFQQMVVAILSSSAFTGAVLEGVRSLVRWREKKKNKGLAKVMNDVQSIVKTTDKTSGQMEELRRSMEKQKETDKVILHNAIHDMYKDMKDDPDITLEDKSNLDYVYEEYKSLHGNHRAEIMYNILAEKPVRRGK